LLRKAHLHESKTLNLPRNTINLVSINILSNILAFTSLRLFFFLSRVECREQQLEEEQQLTAL
jgi:hypothetical protein